MLAFIVYPRPAFSEPSASLALDPRMPVERLLSQRSVVNGRTRIENTGSSGHLPDGKVI